LYTNIFFYRNIVYVPSFQHLPTFRANTLPRLVYDINTGSFSF
jgi:hypothetical protein